MLSKFILGDALEQPQVRVEDRLSCEEADEAAERKERAKRDSHLPAGLAVLREQVHRGDESAHHPDHEGDEDDLPSMTPRSSASFTSPIPIPAG